MENAVEALKIFFAVTVFGLALTVLFRMTSLARDTADAVFSAINSTTYIDYTSYDVSENGQRNLTIQEIIPTIYRYSQEGYAVTIIDSGKIVARFDLDTESQVASCFWSSGRYWRLNDPSSTVSQSEWEKSETIKGEIITYLNTYVLDTVGATQLTDSTLDSLIKSIYGTTNTVEPVYTGWTTANTYIDNDIAKRVNSDVYGEEVTFSTATHKPVCSGDGLLDTYNDGSTFKEYIVQIDTNEYVTDEDGNDTGLLSYGTIRYTKKREIIYVKN